MERSQIKFDELKKLDLSMHVDKKGNFSYLSWPVVTAAFREHCPECTWTVNTYIHSDGSERGYYFAPDGSVLVSLTGYDRENYSWPMHMPVLDHRNKPIVKPNAFDINTAIMRGLVKLIGVMTGIGLHLYMGEDLPPDLEMTRLNESVEFAAEIEESFDKCGNEEACKAQAISLGKKAKRLNMVPALKEYYNLRLEQIANEEEPEEITKLKEAIDGGSTGKTE